LFWSAAFLGRCRASFSVGTCAEAADDSRLLWEVTASFGGRPSRRGFKSDEVLGLEDAASSTSLAAAPKWCWRDL